MSDKEIDVMLQRIQSYCGLNLRLSKRDRGSQYGPRYLLENIRTGDRVQSISQPMSRKELYQSLSTVLGIFQEMEQIQREEEQQQSIKRTDSNRIMNPDLACK